jgi:predicted nucleotidyltransferase
VGGEFVVVIHEEQAWVIARAFAEDVASLLGQRLLAVYVIGSLACGSYRPGRSDIDTLLIVGSDCSPADEDAVDALRKGVQEAYGVPKDFGGTVIRRDKLLPPYDPVEELVPEILRLKHQGVLVWDTYDLTSVPDPTREDFVAYARIFYPWLRTLIDRRPQEYRSVDAAVNTILYELRLLAWDRTGDYILDKSRVIPVALGFTRQFLNGETLEAVQRYLVNDGPLSLEVVEQELQAISTYVREQVPWSVPPFRNVAGGGDATD